MNDDDFLFYADAGSEYMNNVDTGLMCGLQQIDRDIQLFYLGKADNAYTKADAFILTGCDRKKCRDSKQILASFIVLRRTFKAIEFVSEWLTYATDPRAVSDQASVLAKEDPTFIAHRHDQSILSLVAKKWGIAAEALPDPSQYGVSGRRALPPEMEFAKHQYINHTRKKI